MKEDQLMVDGPLHWVSGGWRGGRCLSLAIVSALVVGCGPSGPAVNLVKGVVTLDGAPLADADVGFSPITPGQGLSAVGKTAADGSFVLNAQGARPGRGTAIGDYVITVRKYETPAPVPQLNSDDPNYEPSEPSRKPPSELRSLVPKIYVDKATSPLKATVAKGENSFQFELSPKSK